MGETKRIIEKFIDRLKNLMEKHDIETPYRLGKLIGIKTNVINAWFKEKVRCPDEEYLYRLAEFFDVSPAWLKYGDRTYAPTYRDDVRRIATKLESYFKDNPDAISEMEKIIDVLIKERPTMAKKVAKGK